ncbi:MAG: gliding motility-associated C-terminal domain-containing protein, partial [Bacteroidota bacterium]
YNITCNGFTDGSIDLTVTGGTTPYTFFWNTSDTIEDLTGIGSGNYTVTVSDANGCTDSPSITLTEPAVLASSVSSPTVAGGYNITCNGVNDGSIDHTVTGGTTPYTFFWSNGATTEDLSGLGAGSYIVFITDANGCSDSSSITLTEPPILVTSISSPTVAGGYNLTCNGAADGSIDLTVTGGTTPYTYMWNTADTIEDLNGIGAGIYTVNITDANGCVKSISITLTEPPASLASSINSPTVAGGYNITCNEFADGSIDFTVTGGTTPYTYLWNTGDTIEDLPGIGAGTYSITVTDANGCADSSGITLTEPASLNLVTSFTTLGCNGVSEGTASVISSGGTPPHTYLWDDPVSQTTATATGLLAGTYTITVTDVNGCTTITPVSVSQPGVLSLTTTVIDVSCNGAGDGIATVLVSGGILPYTYLWSDGQTSSTATGLNGDMYSVTVTDSNICSDTISVIINEQPAIELSIDTTNATIGNSDGTASVTAWGGNPPYSYLWSDGQTDATATGLAAGNYSITVLDADGCEASVIVTIIFAELTIPTAITPNGDGANDTWMIEKISYYPNCTVDIYNRWGSLIFHSEGYQEPWDGTFDNKELPVGAYYFIINLNDGNKPRTGSVSILK